MTSSETESFDKPISLRDLDARIARIEQHLGLAPLDPSSYHSATPGSTSFVTPGDANQEKLEIEGNIGEFGLAWVGSIVFFLGITFLIAYTASTGHALTSTAVGFFASAGLFTASTLWKARAPYLSRIVVTASVLLLFYTTMRLHFFSPNPLVSNPYIVLVLLLIVVGLQLYLALQEESQALCIVGILLGMAAALLIDQTHIGLPLVAIFSGITVYLSIRREWWHLLNAGIVFAYTAHLLWLLNNPIAGHPLQAVAEHQYNIIYLFLYAGLFSIPLYMNRRVSVDDLSSIAFAFLNCIGLNVLVFLAALTHFQKDFYSVISFCVFAELLAFSIAQWIRTNEQLGAAIYACFSFVALSVSIYEFAAMPMSFLWLSIQSLFVVSIALWYRSKILVVVNSLIYIGILIGYFALSPSSHPVNFSFAFVALASARVMNWQKERLTLRTEMLRNVYLAVAFLLIFYGLYRLVPGQYVTLSWTLTAVGYFVMSYMLKSKKYRMMAIAAMLVTVVYLFLVDLANLDPLFRVVAFLFLGLVGVAISLYYTRIKRPINPI
jgi:predicted membrane protein DUF2339